ncbi:hypothetical protein D3C79_731760 [compost metagenome]
MNLRSFLHHPGVKTRRLTQRKQLRVIATAQGLRGEYEILIGKLAQVDFPLLRFRVAGGQGHDDLFIKQQPCFKGASRQRQPAHETDICLTGQQSLGL